MDEKVQIRMNGMERLARGDASYCRMLERMTEVERRYDRVLAALPPEQQDAVCDFVSLCEEMNLRKLELACTYLEFPQE